MSKIPKNEEDFLEECRTIKLTWYQELCFRIREFIKLVKVAVHRPYMIKAILTTRCPYCERWLSFPTIQRQRTMYQDDYRNYFCGCKHCHEKNDAYWDDIWEDYYGSR